MNYKVEVIADDSGKWCGNALRFQTHGEATWYANDLRSRWMLVTATRVVESEEEQNARVVANRLEQWNSGTRCNKCHALVGTEGDGLCECGGEIEIIGWTR